MSNYASFQTEPFQIREDSVYWLHPNYITSPCSRKVKSMICPPKQYMPPPTHNFPDASSDISKPSLSIK